MRENCCATCGQTLPPPFPKGVRLSPIQGKIFEVIRRSGQHGISRDSVHQQAYVDDPDGGPEWGNVISVHVNHINKKLRVAGVKIEGERGRASAGYRLVRV